MALNVLPPSHWINCFPSINIKYVYFCCTVCRYHMCSCFIFAFNRINDEIQYVLDVEVTSDIRMKRFSHYSESLVAAESTMVACHGM